MISRSARTRWSWVFVTRIPLEQIVNSQNPADLVERSDDEKQCLETFARHEHRGYGAERKYGLAKKIFGSEGCKIVRSFIRLSPRSMMNVRAKTP